MPVQNFLICLVNQWIKYLINQEKKSVEAKYCGKGLGNVCGSRILKDGCVNSLWDEMEHNEIKIKKNSFIYIFLK